MIQFIRKIKRNPLHFLLGQASLILGILSCLIIYSFVSFHKSFDSYHTDSDNVYRIVRSENKSSIIAVTEGTIKGSLEVNFTDIPVTHFMKTPVDLTFELEDKSITEQDGLLVDHHFFEVFTSNPLSGDISNYLVKPNSLVLTKSLAMKMFGGLEKGINETVTIKNGPKEVLLMVTGIVEDTPANSGLEFSYLMSGESSIFWNPDSPWAVFNTFLKVNHLEDVATVEEFLSKEDVQSISYEFQALTDIHLSEGIEFDSFSKFDKQYLTILSSIGLLIFMLTFFNFLNLFYTQALSRIREITTRKVLGSTKFIVFKALYLELTFTVLVTLLMVSTLLYLLNDTISGFLGFDPMSYYAGMSLYATLMVGMLISAVIIFIITSQLLSYDTQLGLKGKVKVGKLGFDLSKMLLSVQLIVTLFSLTYGLFISEQTNVLKNADVGYTYQNLVTLERPEKVKYNDWINLQQRLLQQAAVQSIGASVFPGIGEYNSMRLKNLETQEKHKLYWIGVDHGYIPTMEIELIQGRNFDSDLKSDEQAIIINQKAQALIGEGYSADQFEFRRKPFKIIGVVRDFNHHSLKEEVQPTMMTLNNPQALRHMNIRYKGAAKAAVLELIKESRKELGIDEDLNPTFAESNYKEKLLAEEHVLSLVTRIFSSIAILISLLGLFSYLNFTTNQKRKDFSIRKVLGANLLNNLQSMLKPQVLTVAIATIISIPSAVYFLSKWKEQFLYQLELNFFHVAIPALLIILIIGTLNFVFSVVIDRMDPVANLKDD